VATTIEKLADWMTELELEQVPQRVIDKCKLQLLSTLAAVNGGHATRPARALREIILSTRANGRSTVFPGGDKTSPTVAVVANAAASMALDYDDYLFMGHTGHSAVLASLAFAEERGLGGADLLRAQVVANELGGRLGAAVIVGPQNGQLWTHIHCLASAAAAACLLRLERVPAAHALALALYQPPLAMWPGFMGPDSKLLSASFPARDGLLAARAASWGLSGPLNILDHPLGFATHFAHQFLPGMLGGLGRVWVSDTLSYKTHPGCAYLSSAVEALAELADSFASENGRPLEPADVSRLVVRTNLLAVQMERLGSTLAPDELRPIRVNFSLPYSLAVMLVRGRLTPAEISEEQLQAHREAIEAAAAKVEIVHDWSMTLDMFARMADHLPVRALLQAIDLRRLSSGLPGLGNDRNEGTTIRRGDLLRIVSFLWTRAPDLVRGASQMAVDGIGWLVGQKDDNSFDLAEADLENFSMVFPAELEVTLAGRQRHTARVDVPAGAAGRDAAETTGLVRRKFRTASTPLLGEQRVEQVLQQVEHLEELVNLSELTDNLCAG